MDTGQLKVDTDYYYSVAGYCYRTGNQIEDMLTDYIQKMQIVSEKGLVSGETADAFAEFISYAQKLQGIIKDISSDAHSFCNDYLRQIDEADDFLF